MLPMSESSEPSNVSEEEQRKILHLAVLEEAHRHLSDACDARRADDKTAYASAVAGFSRVRRAAAAWLQDL